MNTDNTFFSINAFIEANKTKELNKADYIHAFFSQHGFPKDIIISLFELLSPTFEVVNEVVLLENFYSKDEYNRHLQEGSSRETIQFWSNLLDLTSIFACDDHHMVKDFSDQLAHIWNNKIEAIGYQNFAVAKTFLEEDDDSVYITISMP
ncbi:hypothetical protein ACLECX_16705 [Lonsdalea quercina]|uniref:hypothetical protein n=1 Tax=Lonsdalea quercina TaxID=71657 RepID=UPI0039757601